MSSCRLYTYMLVTMSHVCDRASVRVNQALRISFGFSMLTLVGGYCGLPSDTSVCFFFSLYTLFISTVSVALCHSFSLVAFCWGLSPRFSVFCVYATTKCCTVLWTVSPTWLSFLSLTFWTQNATWAPFCFHANLCTRNWKVFDSVIYMEFQCSNGLRFAFMAIWAQIHPVVCRWRLMLGENNCIVLCVSHLCQWS